VPKCGHFARILTVARLEAYARRIRKTARAWTGIPVSIGIGSTKTLAKIANRLAKKSPEAGGVCDLTTPGQLDSALARVSVGDIWGIGGRWAAWLTEQGITTALELKGAEPKRIRQHMHVVGERILQELNGVSCLPLELVTPDKKGITVSRSFGQYLTELRQIKEALIFHVMRAGEKLRRQRLMARHLTVFLNTNQFSKIHAHYSNAVAAVLPYPTDYTPELVHHAVTLLERIFRQGYHYKKCGLMLMDLQPATVQKLDLLDTRDREKQRRLMRTMDAINAQHGARAVHFAAMGSKPAWTTLAERRSARFTTDWEEIPTVKTGGKEYFLGSPKVY
jgi:DNA polymerase V